MKDCFVFISVPGMPNNTSHLSTSAPLSSHLGPKSPEPPLPPRGIKKPPVDLPNNQRSQTQGGPFSGISQSSVNHVRHTSGDVNHARHTSDPEVEIPYMLHRRTPSEPPPRPIPLDNRNTVNIPYNKSKLLLGIALTYMNHKSLRINFQ